MFWKIDTPRLRWFYEFFGNWELYAFDVVGFILGAKQARHTWYISGHFATDLNINSFFFGTRCCPRMYIGRVFCSWLQLVNAVFVTSRMVVRGNHVGRESGDTSDSVFCNFPNKQFKSKSTTGGWIQEWNVYAIVTNLSGPSISSSSKQRCDQVIHISQLSN